MKTGIIRASSVATAIGLALALSGAAAADTGPFTASCTMYGDGRNPLPVVEMTISIDSAASGQHVALGDVVTLTPLRMTLVLPDAVVDRYRAAGETAIVVNTELYLRASTGGDWSHTRLFSFEPEDMPTDGPVTVHGVSDDEVLPVEAQEVGPQTITAIHGIFIETHFGPQCTWATDPVIDTFTVDPVTTPTPTPTSTPTRSPSPAPSPVRPIVVQTDVTQLTPLG